jgi:hypothetical protein
LDAIFGPDGEADESLVCWSAVEWGIAMGHRKGA